MRKPDCDVAQETITILEWDDDFRPRIDDTVMFGIGYDWFGFEYLSQGAKGPNGNYRIWPNPDNNKGNWSLYRTTDGALAFEAYDTQEECKAAAESWCREEL